MIYTTSKKTILLTIILWFIFIFNWCTFWQLTWNEWNITASWLNIWLDAWWVPNEPALQASKINYIDTKFCNDGLEESKLKENLSIVIRPWEEKEICIIHFNRDKKDIYLWGWFPDNAIEPNWNTNCSSNYERDNPFSKFMKPFEDKLVTVPANWYIIRKTTIKFPVWINWTQKWCYAYWVDPWELKKWETLLFLIRKINYIDISVKWKPYTKIEILKDVIIKHKDWIIIWLFFLVLIIWILEIKKYKK
jgi:hypothetical protein